MPAKKFATIPDYIAAAPAAGQPHLRKLHALLKACAPKAQEATAGRPRSGLENPRQATTAAPHSSGECRWVSR